MLAQEIADNNDLKQQVCNDISGVSFRDIDKVLTEILNTSKSNKKRNKDRVEENLVEENDDVYLEPEEPRKRTKVRLEYMLDQDEVNRLIEGSESKPIIVKVEKSNLYYPTYTMAEVNVLLNSNSFGTKEKKKV